MAQKNKKPMKDWSREEMESGQPLNLTEEQKKSGVFVRLRSPKNNPQKYCIPLWKDLIMTPEQLKELRRIKNEIDECMRECGISPENAT